MAQHKWHKEIKAWAAGEEIEGRNGKLDEWSGIENPMWFDDWEYRIKPQPKEPQYLYVFKGVSGHFTVSEKLHQFEYQGQYLGKIKLEEGE